ncbi:putative flavin-containing amine oxidasedehydrogenase [Rosellinia necatrix]|uniref:Putative flavin-containing amine oxidasedehydrogenase n=1 Tax=Rosellinia necatrix TaxID=77044 RepID=A0A1W2TM69_ROSNE|nr:putative flavin-containing amine oxidasedehydrogenase [Rosellinia necatrix]
MPQNENNTPDGRKSVLVVGAGAAGMSTAYHLSQHPTKFDVTLIDAVDYCGGQAFSIPLDKKRYGASWCNQGVQGGSYIFHHTLTMFARQGYYADPVKLQVSFGKDDTFWTNMFPTQLLSRHRREVARLTILLKLMRWFGFLFALLPLRLVFKLLLFSNEFTDSVVLPMTALFLGTGNATPEVPAIMFERLCTSPTYGMWYKTDRNTLISNRPPMVVFPNLSKFYEAWQKDLTSRGVSIRLSTELTEISQRDGNGVVVSLKSRTAVPDRHNPDDAGFDASSSVERFDEIVLCCLADRAKEVLGRTASWREKRILNCAKFSDDITITHNDAGYMQKHYENFYREDLAVARTNGVDQTSRLTYAAVNFRPMYYIKTYPQDKSKLEMCFDTTNYQSQFPEKVPFKRHVFQTIYLNKGRDRHLWSDGEIRKDLIIRQDWWHQLCHSYTHYLFVVPWMMFVQARNHTRFAAAWTLVNAHEVAILSGIAAAVDLGAEYPEDLEHNRFSFLCFRLYYLLAYGKWYYRKYSARGRKYDPQSQSAQDGSRWATGLYGSVYEGPGVSREERRIWRVEVEKGASTGNLAERNAPNSSQP